jgi:RND superfamily putative drug exporter
MTFVTRLSTARPWVVIVGWLVLVGLSLPLALMLPSQLKAGGFSDPRGESAKASALLSEAFDEAPNTLQVVLWGERVTDAVPAAAAAAGGLPQVRAVRDYRADTALLSADGHTTLLSLDIDADGTTTQNLVSQLRDRLRRALPSAVASHVTGAPALDYDLNVQSKTDAGLAEVIAFPLLLVILLLVFRSVAAMLVPLVLAGLALVVTQALGYLVSKVTDLSILFTNGVSLIGLAVAVDYSLFVIKRYREELDGPESARALPTAMRTAGNAVLFSALAVVVALSALFIPRAMVFTSIGLAGVLVTLVALMMSLTLLPAVLKVLGPKISWGLIRRRRERGGRDVGIVLVRQKSRARSAVILCALLAVFGLLAFPATQITLQVPVASARILPEGADSRRGIEALRDGIGTQALFPVQVVLSGRDREVLLSSLHQAVRVSERIAGGQVQSLYQLAPDETSLTALIDGSTDVDPQVATALGRLWATHGELRVTRIVVLTTNDPDSSAAHDLVTDLRKQLRGTVGSGVAVGVTGATASGSDFDQVVIRSAPKILGGVSLATFVLLLVAFGSWRLPLVALALNLVVVAGSLGMLTTLSEQVLGQPINSVTPILLFAIMFGLSMDYMVIMISRMREHFLVTRQHEAAVTVGLQRTAGLVNGAATIMVAVFLSFATAKISIVRELGFGLATAVILDALVVRRVLMPALLHLLSPAVWGRIPPCGPTAAGTDHIVDARTETEVR